MGSRPSSGPIDVRKASVIEEVERPRRWSLQDSVMDELEGARGGKIRGPDHSYTTDCMVVLLVYGKLEQVV